MNIPDLRRGITAKLAPLVQPGAPVEIAEVLLTEEEVIGAEVKGIREKNQTEGLARVKEHMILNL